VRVSVKEIEIATEGALAFGNASAVVDGVSTDTRRECRGALYVPIAGERFDGHAFIEAAFASGAAAALTDRDVELPAKACEGKALIRVANTRAALGQLAAWYRMRFKPPVVGITGSAGKTSTKDMVALVLSKKYRVLKSEGNYNNDIGLPLTLFGLKEYHTAVVLEMGMNHPGEIRNLTMIARPDIAVITNIGLAHIENLGSKRNILAAKYEIVAGLAKNGTLVLNGDDALLAELREYAEVNVLLFGIDETSDVIGSNMALKGGRGVEFEFSWEQRAHRVALMAPGAHNVHNAVAAVAVGLQAGVKPEKIADALAVYKPDKMRMGISEIAGAKIVNDSYNANPQSMEAAIDVLAEVGGHGRKIAILGDMYELGAMAKQSHEEVGAYAADKGVDILAAVGRHACDVARGVPPESGTRVVAFKGKGEAAAYAIDEIRPGDTALVKGSRKMAMEDVVALLEERLSVALMAE
jgi:UDP-N-acetylmuramoyl-tripeptide--D-alanyl-D-alanine ligase